MYGIVNKAIEEFVTHHYGVEIWKTILDKSNVDIEFFISNEAYDDDVTFKLAAAIVDETGLTVGEVLQGLGEWWVLKTAKEKYGGLMQSGGDNLREFLENLPVFHNRVMMIYPKLTPPEFKISDKTNRSLNVHYHSKREGLQEFTRGILVGLGKMYETPVDVNLIQSRDEGSTHEIFKVSW